MNETKKLFDYGHKCQMMGQICDGGVDCKTRTKPTYNQCATCWCSSCIMSKCVNIKA